MLDSEVRLGREKSELYGDALAFEAEIVHLRATIKQSALEHSMMLESAEEQLMQTEEDLDRHKKTHIKLRQEFVHLQDEHKRLSDTIQEIYNDPCHEAHTRHGFARRSSSIESGVEDKVMEENRTLKKEVQTAKEALISQRSEWEESQGKEIRELQHVIESLREDFFASTEVNERLALELQIIKDQALKVKDRNDELEHRMNTEKDEQRDSCGTNHAEESLAMEFGQAADFDPMNVMSLSYDQNLREELQDRVREAGDSSGAQAASASSTAAINLSLQQHTEQIRILRGQVTTLESEKSALEQKLTEIGMHESELGEFRALSTELEKLCAELEHERVQMQIRTRENQALRFMYKDLQRVSVDPSKYNNLRQAYRKLQSTYMDSKVLAEELERSNEILKARVASLTEALKTQNESSDDELSQSSPHTHTTRLHSLQTKSRSAARATMTTMVNALQRKVEEYEAHEEMYKWKIRSAEQERDHAKNQVRELTEELAEVELGRQARVRMPSDSAAQSMGELNTSTIGCTAGINRVAELESELRAERQAFAAYKKEKQRITSLALQNAASVIQQRDEEIEDLHAALRNKQSGSSSRHAASTRKQSSARHNSRSALTDQREPQRGYSRSTGVQLKTAVVLRTSSEVTANVPRTSSEVTAKGVGHRSLLSIASQGTTGRQSVSLDDLLQSTSIRDKCTVHNKLSNTFDSVTDVAWEAATNRTNTPPENTEHEQRAGIMNLDMLLRSTSIREKALRQKDSSSRTERD